MEETDVSNICKIASKLKVDYDIARGLVKRNGAEIVSAYHKHLGTSLREMARRSNVSVSMLSKVMNGECRLTINLAAKLYRTFGEL